MIIEDKNFVKELKSGVLAENPIKSMSENQALNYIDKNITDMKNPFIKYARKLNWIETVKDTSGKIFRNPLKYLDLKALNNNYEDIVSTSSDFIKQGGENLEKFVAKKAKIKRFGIYSNLIVSSFAVCYLLPKLTYGFRRLYTGSSEEPGIKQVLKNAEQK